MNTDRVRALAIPIAPVQEAKEIVKEIERLTSIVGHIEKTIEQSLGGSSTLCQSILRQAFQGKLVAQDPGDEPAKKLVERMKIERSGQDEAPRLRKEKKRR